MRCVTRVKICLCQMMDAGDTLLSIPADTPMEQLSPIHIVRPCSSFLLENISSFIPQCETVFDQWCPIYCDYRWMKWMLKVCLWKNRDFPTDEEECKSIKDEPLEPMIIKFCFIPWGQYVLLSYDEMSSLWF